MSNERSVDPFGVRTDISEFLVRAQGNPEDVATAAQVTTPQRVVDRLKVMGRTDLGGRGLRQAQPQVK